MVLQLTAEVFSGRFSAYYIYFLINYARYKIVLLCTRYNNIYTNAGIKYNNRYTSDAAATVAVISLSLYMYVYVYTFVIYVASSN